MDDDSEISAPQSRTRGLRERWQSAPAPCVLAGCQFGGLNSLDMPGTAGHGAGSYTVTVELPDVATLPQNSPVMVDDVTVGSVSGIDAVQRPDGTFYAAVQLSLDEQRQPAGQRDGEGRADLAARLPARRAVPSRSMRPRSASSPRARRSRLAQTGRYPTTEEVLSSLGVVVNKGNLGALQDITDEAYNAVAGRAGSFADLVPRLAELTSSLDRQTNDIIAAAEGLNRFAGILARSKDSLGRTLDTLPAALKVLNNNRGNIVDAFAALQSFADDRLAHPGRRPRTTSLPTSRTSIRSSRRSTTTPITSSRVWSSCRLSRSTTSTCATRCGATTSTCS